MSLTLAVHSLSNLTWSCHTRRIPENGFTLWLIAVVFLRCDLPMAQPLRHTIQVSGEEYAGHVADITGGVAIFVGESGRYCGDYVGTKAEGHGVYEGTGGDACYGEWENGMRNGYVAVHWPDAAIFYGQYNGNEDEWVAWVRVSPSGERTFTSDDALPVPFNSKDTKHADVLRRAKESEVLLLTNRSCPRAKLCFCRMRPRLPRGGQRCAAHSAQRAGRRFTSIRTCRAM
jgi:hypothetical protein